MNIAELFVRLSADTSGLKKGMTSAQTSMDMLKRTALAMGGVLSAGALFSGIIRNSSDAQATLAQLEARILSTGGAAGRSVDQLLTHSAALQKITTFGDEAIQTAQALLLTFKKIRGDEFDRATEATLDLATAMGGDLKGAALQLGKALEDPVRGLTALRRSGVSFTEAQQDVIKNLVETGRVAEAQNLILGEMETQFGGAATAARNTLGGALTALGEAWGDQLEMSRESSGGIIAAIEGITTALPALRRELDRVVGGWQNLVTWARAGAARALEAAGQFEAAAKLWASITDPVITRARMGVHKSPLAQIVDDTADDLDKITDQMREAAAITEAMREPTEVWTDRIAVLDAHLKANRITLETWHRAVADATVELGEAVKKSEVATEVFKKVRKETEEHSKKLVEHAAETSEFGNAMENTAERGLDAFVDFALGSSEAIGNFVRRAMRDLAMLAVKMAALGILKSVFAGATGGLGGLINTALGGGGGKSAAFAPSSLQISGGNWAAASAAMPALQRPMTPREAARDVWWSEFIREGVADNSERGG